MVQKNVRTVNIDQEIHRQAKIEAAKRRVPLKELVEKAVRLFLAQPS